MSDSSYGFVKLILEDWLSNTFLSTINLLKCLSSYGTCILYLQSLWLLLNWRTVCFLITIKIMQPCESPSDRLLNDASLKPVVFKFFRLYFMLKLRISFSGLAYSMTLLTCIMLLIVKFLLLLHRNHVSKERSGLVCPAIHPNWLIVDSRSLSFFSSNVKLLSLFLYSFLSILFILPV